MRPRSSASLVLLALALGGCTVMDDQTGSPVPGCSLPADVDGLLDGYADDPVLTLTPDGARRVGDAARSRGCRRLNKEDVSNTSVSLSWRPDRDWGDAELRRTYDPVASAAGWRYAEIPDRRPAVDGEGFLSWCRSVRDVPSRLIVRSDPAQRVDVRPSTADRSPSPQWQVASPAGIYLTIFADQTCPASRRSRSPRQDHADRAYRPRRRRCGRPPCTRAYILAAYLASET